MSYRFVLTILSGDAMTSDDLGATGMHSTKKHVLGRSPLIRDVDLAPFIDFVFKDEIWEIIENYLSSS